MTLPCNFGDLFARHTYSFHLASNGKNPLTVEPDAHASPVRGFYSLWVVSSLLGTSIQGVQSVVDALNILMRPAVVNPISGLNSGHKKAPRSGGANGVGGLAFEDDLFQWVSRGIVALALNLLRPGSAAALQPQRLEPRRLHQLIVARDLPLILA